MDLFNISKSQELDARDESLVAAEQVTSEQKGSAVRTDTRLESSMANRLDYIGPHSRPYPC